MHAGEVRRRFQAALAGGYDADWYDQGRHDAERLGSRFLAGLPVCAAVTSSTDHLAEDAHAVSRPYFARIRAEARRRGIPGY